MGGDDLAWNLRIGSVWMFWTGGIKSAPFEQARPPSCSMTNEWSTLCLHWASKLPQENARTRCHSGPETPPSESEVPSWKGDPCVSLVGQSCPKTFRVRRVVGVNLYGNGGQGSCRLCVLKCPSAHVGPGACSYICFITGIC